MINCKCLIKYFFYFLFTFFKFRSTIQYLHQIVQLYNQHHGKKLVKELSIEIKSCVSSVCWSVWHEAKEKSLYLGFPNSSVTLLLHYFYSQKVALSSPWITVCVFHAYYRKLSYSTDCAYHFESETDLLYLKRKKKKKGQRKKYLYPYMILKPVSIWKL